MSTSSSGGTQQRHKPPSELPQSTDSSPSVVRYTPESYSDGDDEQFSPTVGAFGQDIPLRTLSAGQTYEDEDGDMLEDDEKRFIGLGRRPSRSSTVQSFELYTPDEDKAVLRKLDRRLVTFMALLYMLSFLDRSNIGNARIAGLDEDLDLTSSQYEWLLTAFYITYIAFEWMTLMYRVISPHIYISLCVSAWGLLASLQSITTSFISLVLLRALLGISEAAFGPGVPFYLSFFFRREELAFRTGLFISAAPLATSFASSLAWLITKLGEGGAIEPWRLLFLIEGFPSIFVAVFAWTFIPDSPETAIWLSSREQKVALLRLRNERSASHHSNSSFDPDKPSKRRLNFREISKTLLDPKCYLTAGMFFSSNVAFSSLPVFLPTIINDMGYSALKSQALSAPPYLVAFGLVLLTAYFSDRFRTRWLFIVLHALLAASGYALLAIAGHYRWSIVWRYLGVYAAASGFFSAITIIITWTLNNQRSAEGKGTGLALLNIIGQMGPLVGTRLYPDKDAPYFVMGMTVCAFFMLLVGVLALVLRLVLVRENRRREREMAFRDGLDEQLLAGRVGRGRGGGTAAWTYML